ncbi:DUF3320 domain-containing protein [Lysobacter sp. Root983]|uniref:DUF3320 domain-containing protein n=1 Tax=Lysobacter sp. Root983 TaxID=1736613 RepID=UPI0007102840|nr:DUF3320 domain-containing protein [Lysobacter sp. Root983]KRD79733.1 DNA helicase [Lysobacter sp. Root983]
MEDQNGQPSEEGRSTFQGSGFLIEKIERARNELLDLSTRNRLLHTPRGGRARLVDVVNELAQAMYQTLVLDKKRFTFQAGRADPTTAALPLDGDGSGVLDEDDLEQPIDPDLVELTEQPDLELDEEGRVVRHWDSHLSTRLTSSGLQKRLLDLYTDARTLQEEQGVNVLYLAIGYLKWRAAQGPQTDRYAPLVLVPVILERSNAGEKFHLRWSGDDIQANLSLQLMLRREFQLKLPEIEDFENLNVDSYFRDIGAMIEGKANWEVCPNDAVLGLFSFAKFMMYHDLDPAQWARLGGLEAIDTLRGVVSDGFPGATITAQDARVDELIQPGQLMHVVDCDSSQSLVVHDVRQGRNILVQGPPGTGKSQTIANIIAAAIADKKKVLFVAEKMAALEVVKRRLDNAKIGVACLELHSNKANKRALLQELSQTWTLAPPLPSDPQSVVRQLQQRREELTAHVERLHRPLAPSNLAPYEVFGHLVRLRRQHHVTGQLALVAPLSWDADDKKDRIAALQDLIERIDRMSLPKDHAWVGVGNDALLPNDRDRLIGGMATLLQQLKTWIGEAGRLHTSLDLPAPIHFADTGAAVVRATALAAAPAMSSSAFIATEWDRPEAISGLLDGLERAQRAKTDAEAVADPTALNEDWTETLASLTALLPTFTVGVELQQLAATHDELTRLQTDLVRLAQLLSEKAPLTFETAMHLVALAERATSVPEIDRDALVARIWERGVDSIEELVDAIERIQGAKEGLKGVFRDNAWTQDLEGARTQLASRGSSWLRILSGEWRQANRRVRSYLTHPKLPADEVLVQLDTLLDAQAAQHKLAQRDQEGLEAFGAAWMRERSSVGFLRGVVSWMRTLRPLGADARERLANISDPEQAAQVAKRLRPALEVLQRALAPTHDALVASELSPWGGEVVLKRVPLLTIWTRTAPLKKAFEQVQGLHDAATLPLSEASRGIDSIREAQAALAALDGAESTGQSSFGALWRGLESAPDALKAAVQWQQQHPGLRSLAARIPNAKVVLAEAEHSAASAQDVGHALQGVFFNLQLADATGTPRVAVDMPLTDLVQLLQRWEADPEGLPEWVAYVAQAKKAQQLGLGAVVEAMGSGTLATDRAVGAFELAYFEAVLAKLVELDPQLASFDGQKQSQLVAEFSQLDLERMGIARREILAVHYADIPQSGGAAGPTKLLRGEMAKKKGHLPIRRLMELCGPAIQALKPVFMMSPLSVAQFLPAGALAFDMLIIDEASQVQPIDAFGAIARAKQLVIVGDEKQLPPTQFFAKTLAGDGDGANDDDGAQAADVESILGLCRAQGLPERMLEWHYRSRHQSLIAVSNREFYKDRLKIVPSPFTSEAGVGLRFHHLPEAIYDRGGKRTNTVEAKAVAQAVIAHALSSPNLSLGVVAFSTQQRRAIQDEVELLRRQHPETEGYFSGRLDEPFFVKNLENVQGDERDVIFISIGYGRDALGVTRMDFGPVSREGGERRLNVLISRAKTRCEVFSSITDDDIDTERGKGKGTLALKLFLHYARTGRMDLSGGDPDRHLRIFEEQVAVALRDRNYDLHTNVGISGFFVDLAVSDPTQPGRYILGIEFDGPSYRAENGARDRDRLRESALAAKGWRLHRIWIYDWFHRPQAELERLVKAIEAAKQEPARFDVEAPTRQRAVPIEIETVDLGDVTQVGLVSSEPPSARASEAYIEASFHVPNGKQELHEVPPHRMAEIVRQVVDVEGPIHRAEVVVRIRSLWGLQRAGGRIQAAVDAGISTARGQRTVEIHDGYFLDVPDRTPKVRDRSGTQSPSLRRPDYLPPSEVGVAVLALVKDNLGATVDEAIQFVARQLGYKSTSAQLRVVIEDRAKLLVDQGALTLNNGVLNVASGG